MRSILMAVLAIAGLPGPAPADPADPGPDLEALRSLPYVSSSPVPEARSGVILQDPARICRGLRLYTIEPLARAELIDADGDSVHAWSWDRGGGWMHAELLPDGGLLVVGTRALFDPERSDPELSDPELPEPDAEGGSRGRYVARLDSDSRPVWVRRMSAHHDVEVRPDGKVAVLAFELRRVPEIRPDIDTRVDGIVVLDAGTGKVVDSWNFLDAVSADPDVFPLEDGPVTHRPGEVWVDLFHANSVEWMDREALFGTSPLYDPGHVLVCFRHQDRVAIFDAAEHRVLWAWGRGEISGPHDAQLLPGGNVLLFDNGQERGWSRAIEVDPRTDEIVWEWKADPPESFYTESRGSVQRLPNGNALLAESDRGGAREIAPDGTTVWQFVNPHRRNRDRPLAIVRVKWIGSGEEYGFRKPR